MIHQVHSISLIFATVLAGVLAANELGIYSGAVQEGDGSLQPVIDDEFNQQLIDFSDKILNGSIHYSRFNRLHALTYSNLSSKEALSWISQQFARFHNHHLEFIVICGKLRQTLIIENGKISVIYDDLFKLACGQTNLQDAESAALWIIQLLTEFQQQFLPILPYPEYRASGVMKFAAALITKATQHSQITASLETFFRVLLLNSQDLDYFVEDRFIEFVKQMSPDQIESFIVRETVIQYVGSDNSDVSSLFAVKIMFLLCAENDGQDQQRIGKISRQKADLMRTIYQSYRMDFRRDFVPEWAKYYQNDQDVVQCSNPDSVLIQYAHYVWDKKEGWYSRLCYESWIDEVIPPSSNNQHIRHRLFRCLAHSFINREVAHESMPGSAPKLIEELIKKMISGFQQSFISLKDEGLILLAAQLVVSSISEYSLPDILHAIKLGFGIECYYDTPASFGALFNEETIQNPNEFMFLALLHDQDWTRSLVRQTAKDSLFYQAQCWFLSRLFTLSSPLIQTISYLSIKPDGLHMAGDDFSLHLGILDNVRGFWSKTASSKCEICGENFTDDPLPRVFRPCNHTYHRRCVKKSPCERQAGEFSCPICHQERGCHHRSSCIEFAANNGDGNDDRDLIFSPCGHGFYPECIEKKLVRAQNNRCCPGFSTCMQRFYDSHYMVMIHAMIESELYGIDEIMSHLIDQYCQSSLEPDHTHQ